jgi:hypothetical protein
MYRYFADTTTGNIIAKEQYTRSSMFTQSPLWADSEQDLDPDQYRVDITTNTLVAKSQ